MNTTGLRAWRESLLATAGLAAAIFAATLLWQFGHPQWAFALSFAAAWALIAAVLSSVQFTEQSGLILAHIVDSNFEDLHERVVALEAALEKTPNARPGGIRKAP
ncbi:MAG: hypothetical protein HKO85_10645 [Xanthomonadales bacterium]|nr:hypothetical protein [Gammaproteobacteria bacterium]MBT8057924.1 hypothetical protein [Gammaproteobacteria bacterium]NNL05735.1 hypothetical protein [Xanthomonadales bacterium]